MSATIATAIPDYAERAATELRDNAQQWSVCAQSLIDAFDDNVRLHTLLGITERLTRTLRLLGYQAVCFGLDEVLLLLRHWSESPLVGENEAALVLLQVADELEATLALPASQARKLSALGWLEVIDNCRACRQAPALSKDVVAAAGIALPSTSLKPLPARSDCIDFLKAIRGVHKLFARQLGSWFREPGATAGLAVPAKTFLQLADACRTPSRLSTLEPLFRSAGVVLGSLVADSTRSNIAVQRLFAKLERYLAKLGELDFDTLSRIPNPLPDDVLRQLLFYVSEFPNSSKHAQKLRKDYGLHVLAATTRRANEQRPPRIKLPEQVLAQIGLELDELQTWLGQAANDPGHERAVQLFTRLDEQYTALGLLGFSELKLAIDSLRKSLRRLKSPVTENQRLAVAEQLLQVRECLDAPVRIRNGESSSGGLSSSAVDDFAHRLRQLSRRGDKNQFQAMAAVACIRAVQDELRRAEPEVLALLDGAPLLGASASDIGQRLQRAAIAVQVIPLPEVRPLLEGLAVAIETKLGPESCAHLRGNLAELLVALDLYLDSVMSDSRSLTSLLQHAVEAMNALGGSDTDVPLVEDVLDDDDVPALSPTISLTPTVDAPATAAPESVASADTVLDAYLLANKQIIPWISGKSSDRDSVESALLALHEVSEASAASEISTLVADCAAYVQRSPVPADARDLVSETLSVVPQMLHAEPGVAESVRGLDTLRQRLAPLDSIPDPLDNTLHDVFVRECASHIDTLRDAISVARADIPLSKLPSEKMLRALHTLTGCAQTVDAHDIVAIVQPLQKAAMGLQRSEESFSDDETDFIDQLSDAMEARLRNFESEGAVEQSVLDAESRLPEFVNTVMARVRPAGKEVSADTKVSSWVIAKSSSIEPSSAGLLSIFRAEADDLMLRLRSHTTVLLSSESQITSNEVSGARDGALKVLHTIKGSARMAGNHAMADVAHELESDIASIKDPIEFGENLRQCFPRLQQTLSSSDHIVDAPTGDADATEITASVADDSDIDVSKNSFDNQQAVPDVVPLPLSENSMETLLDSGTMLVSRQAQVDDGIAFLRDHIRDIQASADRLQRLAQNNPAFESVAARELVADIEAARRQLEESVHELWQKHGLASQAGTALHRLLVQSQLRTVDSILPRLQATLGDALTVCDRDASLLLTGGDIPVASDTLKSLAPLLEQLIRNAVAHGMTSVSVREAEHKPADGEIAITVRIDGLDLLVEVSDDGEGVDEDALSQQRLEAGLDAVRNTAHLREILCSPGYSTLDDASPVAGRGQGLGMVLDGVEALAGELELINDPGEGLTVRLRVPQKMLVAQSLVFGQGASLHAIPVNYISHVVVYNGEADEVRFQNQSWVVTSVEQLMGVPDVGAQAEPAERCALITVSGECVAVPLPALVGYKELLVQPLGAQLKSLERYVGGALLSDGRQTLILNLHRLMQLRVTTRNAYPMSDDKACRTEPLSALVADDSVTMRVAGERLLQRLGFQVHTARDGLEALDFLNRSLPSVLLLDIEMPGADGFDVVRRIRSELVAAQVPVIMISTRRGPQERERARSLGVRHLIHKPYTETQLREALEEVGVLAGADIEF